MKTYAIYNCRLCGAKLRADLTSKREEPYSPESFERLIDNAIKIGGVPLYTKHKCSKNKECLGLAELSGIENE